MPSYHRFQTVKGLEINGITPNKIFRDSVTKQKNLRFCTLFAKQTLTK
jgi:hypothetical protein